MTESATEKKPPHKLKANAVSGYYEPEVQPPAGSREKAQGSVKGWMAARCY